MNKLQKGLIGFGLTGLLAVSGCSLSGRIGGHECVNRSKSYYASEIEKKADELFEEKTLESREKAVKGYGDIGKLDKMDKGIRWIINEDLSMGLIYSEFGDEYHKMHKK